MADPISCVTLLAEAATSVHETATFIQTIKGAPDCVKQVSNDLTTVERPLNALRPLIEQTDELDRTAKVTLNECLIPALSSCEEAAKAIGDYLRPFVKPDKNPRRSVWRRLQWSFEEGTVETLRVRLTNTQNSLQVAIGVATVLLQDRHSKQVHELETGLERILSHFANETSTVTQPKHNPEETHPTSHHESITDWVSETQTVVDKQDAQHQIEKDPKDDKRKVSNDLPSHEEDLSRPNEASKPTLPIRAVPSIESNKWYYLTNLGFPNATIDVISNPATDTIDIQLQLVPKNYCSGQLWEFQPSKRYRDRWKISTQFSGPSLSLDVYGNDKTWPHLATSGNFTGQSWLAKRKFGEQAWMFSNLYSGDHMVLTARQTADGLLKLAVDPLEKNSKAQLWEISPV